MNTIHATTQFERSPNSISSYSVNLGLTEWTKDRSEYLETPRPTVEFYLYPTVSTALVTKAVLTVG